jgi:hypothetical protein
VKRIICSVLAVAALAALAFFPLSASAWHQDVTDPDDTKGRLDIRRVETWGAHRDMGYEIKTFRRWTVAEMWDAGFIAVNVDTWGTARTDYYVLVRSTGRTIEGLLFRDREKKRDYIMRKVKVWRPDRRTVRFRFPWDDVRIPDSRLAVRWFVSSIFSNDYCLNVCIDRAPNSGQVTTMIRPSPTPTPTLTETPTP